jgi:Zn finger protein HypA/HybF involved in hydrogenase expression
MGLAAEIYRIARGGADDRRGGPLDSVTVAIGDLAIIDPDLLESAWKTIVAGSADAGARLIIDWRAAKQICPRCGEIRERVPGSWLRLCPHCEEPLAISGGDERDVRTITFSDGPSAAGETADRDRRPVNLSRRDRS